MARKLRLAFAVSALAFTLASLPAEAGTGDLRPVVDPRGFLSALWSRVVALFTPYEALNEQDEDPINRDGGPQGRGYIDPNGIDAKG